MRLAEESSSEMICRCERLGVGVSLPPRASVVRLTWLASVVPSTKWHSSHLVCGMECCAFECPRQTLTVLHKSKEAMPRMMQCQE